MNVHKNAELAPAGRALLVQRVATGTPQTVVAAAFGVSTRTVGKWVRRWGMEGPPGLVDRSSRPQRCPHQLRRRQVRQIAALRRRRVTSPAIAQPLQRPVSTVGLVLRRLGLNRLRLLEPPQPPRRYERARPGELLHVDVKKLGRIARVGHRIHGDRRARGAGAGWAYVHVCIDDATRVAYCELLPAEDKLWASVFLHRAVAWFRQLGVSHVERVMTDNGSAYRSKVFCHTLTALGARHLRTRPYTPRTNGKAEHRTSARRAAALPFFLRHYNMERPHTAVQRRPPLARLLELNEQPL